VIRHVRIIIIESAHRARPLQSPSPNLQAHACSGHIPSRMT
jgi:hypothetical protein